MAKNTQEAEVLITMNGKAAENALAALRKQQEQCNDAIKAGIEAQKELDKLRSTAIGDYKKVEGRGYKEQEEYLKSIIKKGKEGTTTLNRLKKEINVTELATKKYAEVLKNINGSSLAELQAVAKQLKFEIRQLPPDTQKFIDKTKQLQDVNTRIKQITGSFAGLVQEQKRSALSLRGLVDGFNHYWGFITMAVGAVTGVTTSFKKAAQAAAELDDVYADVMKTTGLLHEEVADLDKELMKIDTRTSREQLLLLARDAGKLGIQGEEDILGFVRAADQIQVALGEDLGEGAIRNLGKIADVLGYTKSMGIEKSLLSIASSINAVGQASTASESYLVDFTQRMAGVAAQTGISAANIIGFASGLDQSAMKVEMASTAFQKFLMKLYEDPAKFAAYANLEVGKFTELLQNDANQAVITILKALKDQDGFASLVPIFKDMGLDGARAVSVLAAMATNINAVTDAQALANAEFQKATSVTEEYNTKNNNMQAQLEKARKEFQNASIALGQSLNPIMLKSTKATTYLIKALAQYGKEIKTVLVVIVALTAALKAKVAWQKIVATWNATLRASSLALAAAQALLTGNVTRAAAAWAMMNTAMKASVFGVVAAAIAGVVIALQRLNKKQEETNLLKEKSIALDKKIADAGTDEIARVKQLSNVVHDQMRSYYERNKALEELKRLVPDYQASLTKEGQLINDNIVALDNYIQKIKQSALEKLLAEEIADLAQRETEANLAKESHQNALDEAKTSYSGDSYMGHSANEGMISTMEELLAADEVVLTGIAEERKQLTDKIQKMIAAGDLVIENAGGSGSGGNGNGNGSGNSSKTNNAYQEALKDLKQKQMEEENSWKELYANNKISKEKYDEEMLKINMKYLERQVKLAGEYGQDETAVMSAWLDAQIAANQQANKEIDALLQQRSDWEKQQQEELEAYQKQIEALVAEGEKVKASLNPSVARTKEMQTELDKLEELHQAKILSEQEYEEAVKQLRKKYADEDLKEKLANVQKYVEQSNMLFSEASNFVTALKEAESAKLEAQYQADLTAAGDNAEKKASVEAEYEQKKLDLQKKYADTEMAINIAKTIAAGALAAIQAFAQLGPIGGAVAAALIAVITAAEVATIIQQRNAIKSASAGGGAGGSSSAPTTGERKMTGYAEGGYTVRSASDRKAAGVVHANEWVAPAWMVRQNPVTFANLERYRKAGSHGRSGSVERGFAEGGYTGKSGKVSASMGGGALTHADIEAAVEAAIRRSMADGAIRAYLVRKDLTELDSQTERFKKQTSR